MLINSNKNSINQLINKEIIILITLEIFHGDPNKT